MCAMPRMTSSCFVTKLIVFVSAPREAHVESNPGVAATCESQPGADLNSFLEGDVTILTHESTVICINSLKSESTLRALKTLNDKQRIEDLNQIVS